MPLSKAALFIGLLACAQAGMVLGLYRFGLADSIALLLLYVASLVACYVLLGRTAEWASGRHSLRFVVALVLAGAAQAAAVVVALAVAFNIWGT